MFDRIGICLCSCGKCCHDQYPCDKCLERVMKANGIPVEHVGKFKGLCQKPYNFNELERAVRKHLLEAQPVS